MALAIGVGMAVKDPPSLSNVQPYVLGTGGGPTVLWREVCHRQMIAIRWKHVFTGGGGAGTRDEARKPNQRCSPEWRVCCGI